MTKQRYWPAILVCTATLSACNFMPLNSPASEENAQHSAPSPELSGAEPIDVNYADAKAEANFAIQKQDYHLLALNNKALSIPGIDLNNHDLAELEQQCGLKILTNSNDEMSADDELALSKKLFAYAAQYNQLVLQACRNH